MTTLLGELPPEGAVVLLTPAACDWVDVPVRFRVIVARAGERPDTVLLRGWFLDGRAIREEHVTAALSALTVVSA
ncbi:MAG: hypothetical protein WCA46_26160 [Actinocatenispora sp.]